MLRIAEPAIDVLSVNEKTPKLLTSRDLIVEQVLDAGGNKRLSSSGTPGTVPVVPHYAGARIQPAMMSIDRPYIVPFGDSFLLAVKRRSGTVDFYAVPPEDAD